LSSRVTPRNQPVFEARRYAGPAGFSLAADVGGDPRATAVILMHGGGQTRHSWREAASRLVTDGYHVITLDARGHGDSDWSASGDYKLDAFAADLLAVIATLKTPPVLVGASLGGSTGLYAVGNSSTLIASALVMVDIVPRVDLAGAEKIMNFMRSHPDGFANVEEAIDAVVAYNPHRRRPRDPAGLMKNLRRKSDGRLYWHWDPRILDSPSRLEPPDLVEPLLAAASRVRIPTLLVRGMLSDVVTDAAIDELRGVLPGLEVYGVAQAGHMVAGDRNDVFSNAIGNFLRRHAPVLSPAAS
jgi:pimeloyl-ACP methyl ester carboxylesterase